MLLDQVLGDPAVAGAAREADVLEVAVDEAAVLVAPEPAVERRAVEHRLDLRPQLPGARLVGAEQLVVAEQDGPAIGMVRPLPRDPRRLVAVQAGVLVGGVEPEELPVLVGEREAARAALGGEARVAERGEVVLPARVHVVVAVERVRGDVGPPRPHRPRPEEVVAVLVVLAAVVDVAEVDDVLLAPLRRGIVEHLRDLRRRPASRAEAPSPSRRRGRSGRTRPAPAARRGGRRTAPSRGTAA